MGFMPEINLCYAMLCYCVIQPTGCQSLINLCYVMLLLWIPECLRGVFMTRRYTNPRLPLPLQCGNCEFAYSLQEAYSVHKTII